MIHYLVAFGVLLHVLFWGAGLAILAMPRAWRRFWPVLVAPAGLALQSAMVWAGAHANVAGTNRYAVWCELVPVVLLVLGLRRRLRPGGGGFNDNLRAAMTDVARFGVVWAGLAASLGLLVLPLAIASRGLTTISLGSCDAADYAGGARVLMEFARTDRSGFLGLTEVVRVHSVDNFFDYWLRLNHFTPSALIAFNGSVLDCAAHELTSIMGMVLLAGSVPTVFWIARAVIGYSGGASVVIAVLYAVNPITWYAVAHVALGQLLAAQAIAFLTWSGFATWRQRLTWRRGAHFAGVLAIGYWLVLGSYNFILVLCLVPALAYVSLSVLLHGKWPRLGRWIAVMLLPLGACMAVFVGRTAGLAERFSLLQSYDFGWRIPALTPEGWLGMVQGPDLQAWDFFGLRWVLFAIVFGLFGWALARAFRHRHRGAWSVLAITAPVLIGYFMLQVRGARLGTNASYDAYKLFAVFYPLLLPALCWWVTLRRSRRLIEWAMVVGVAIGVCGFNLLACGMFAFSLARPPLLVDGELRQLRRVDAMPDVRSVNVLVPDMWSRLWANAFLLRKEQYFPTHTYEARLNTSLRGEWDLEGGVVALRLPGEARRQITPRFALVSTAHRNYVRVTTEEGWYDSEGISNTSERWQWTAGAARLRIENPHARPLTLACRMDARSLGEREVTLTLEGETASAPLRVGEQRNKTMFAPIEVPPGRSVLRLASVQPPTLVPGDARPLALCVYRIEIDVRD